MSKRNMIRSNYPGDIEDEMHAAQTKKLISDDPLFAHFPKSLLQRFREYHAENPQVFAKLRDLAYDARRAGQPKTENEEISCDFKGRRTERLRNICWENADFLQEKRRNQGEKGG